MKLDYDNLKSNQLIDLIKTEKTFEVTGLSGRMGDAVALIEREIEKQDRKCRVYTYGRVAAAGGTLFGGVTGVLGLASAVGIAAHNLATLNPDYEISKHLLDNSLLVKYCK